MKRIASTLIAGAALFGAQAAQAQQSCIAPEDLDDALRYAMPMIYEAAMSSCGDQYSASGFMKTEGPAFADGFRALQDDAWPGALRLIKAFAAKGGEDGEEDPMAGIIDSIPPDALRPFIDAMVIQLVAGEIKPDTCGKIERGVELIAPLPPENVTGLLTFIAEQTKLDNPPLCGVEIAGAIPDGTAAE